MIRKLLNGDIDRVADIWLKTNLKAHYFISNQYWKSNYELVKEMMSQSEVYVFEVDKIPFKKSRENFYENNKEGKLKNLLDNFYYKEDIDSIVNEIEKLLNCG